MIKTLPNNTSGRRMFQCLEIAIPSCCPVSKNPREGSKITISYRAKKQVLEMAHLYACIHRFVGGLHSEGGSLEIRDMEGMLNRIAWECAQSVGVMVRVRADWYILPKMMVHVIARGYPESEVA